MSQILRAREAFAFTSRTGVPRQISPGDLISADDPDVKGKEHLFEPVDVHVARAAAATETASAAPGEVRSRRPYKKTAQAPAKPEPTPEPEGDK